MHQYYAPCNFLGPWQTLLFYVKGYLMQHLKIEANSKASKPYCEIPISGRHIRSKILFQLSFLDTALTWQPFETYSILMLIN